MCTCFSILPPLLLTPFFFFLFSLTELQFVGQFVSVVSCPLAAHFQSTWLYILCTLSLVSCLLCSSQVNKQSSPISPGMLCTPHPYQWTGLIPMCSYLLNIGGHNWTEQPRCVSPGLRRQECHLPPSASCTFDSTAQDVVYFLFSLQSYFTASHPPACTSSSVSPLRCRTWHFLWFSLIYFL